MYYFSVKRSTKSIAEHETRMEAYSSIYLSLLSKFNGLIDKVNAADGTIVAETYQILISALSVWRNYLEDYIREHHGDEVKKVYELWKRAKSQLINIKDNESSINMRYRLYKGSCEAEIASQSEVSITHSLAYTSDACLSSAEHQISEEKGESRV